MKTLFACVTTLAMGVWAAPALSQTYTVEDPFPSLTFNNPILVEFAPGHPGRLFILEKAGRIRTFLRSDANPVASTYLDISGRTVSSSEQGLLGLAFDPNFATTGRLYVHYSWNGTNPGTTRISRFTVNPPLSLNVNPSSEEVLFSAAQPQTNHNGGTIAFGRDGLLYIFLGDGGGANDPLNLGQNLTSPLGKALRIDVSGPTTPPKPYGIPADNPFLATSGAVPEIYAYGLRNPYRASVDAATGDILIGDVGQGDFEEINVLRAGANFGWRLKEGFACFNPPTGCGNVPGLTDPVIVYDHSQGQSVTGGIVARGPGAPPALRGRYIYGDYVNGRIWSSLIDGTARTATTPQVVVNGAGFNISSFGTDETGNVWITQYGGAGKVRRLSQVGASTSQAGLGWQLYD